VDRNGSRKDLKHFAWKAGLATAVIVLGAALAIAWFGRTRAHASIPVNELAVTNSPAEQQAPENGIQTASLSRAEASGVPTVSSSPRSSDLIEIELAQAMAQEQTGQFRKLYAAWQEDEDDPSATEDAERFFDTALATLGIRPQAEFIRCGERLCRARFRYGDLKELYRMTEIDEPDGVKVATTFPENGPNSHTVSIYWTRNPNPQDSLTETAGQ
jgi:hypothetical protein